VDILASMSEALRQQAAAYGDTAGAAFYGNQQAYYANLADSIRTNFFFDKATYKIQLNDSGYITNIGNGAQADFGLALFFNMVPDTQRVSCVHGLLTNAHNGIFQYNDGYTGAVDNTNHISGGIQSCGRIMMELTTSGYNDVAYRLLTDLRFPSWLYNVTNGMPGVFQNTTVLERWNGYISGSGNDHGYLSAGGGNSFNHYAFGCVGEWVWRNVAGINPDDTAPGYGNVIINPKIGGGLTYAAGSFNSIRGLISSSWTTNNTTNSYSVVIPANCTASFYIPSTNLAHITESGLPATNAVGVIYCLETNGSTLFHLGSGAYYFTNWP